MIETLYKTITTLCQPLIYLHLKKRQWRGKEDRSRFKERLGRASRPRPDGYLLWCHAASVGEAKSLLAIVHRLRAEKRGKKINILVTTGTRTSAEMMSRELPEDCLHQFAPVDCPAWIRRFLDHWQPNLILWLESELWPNLMLETSRRGIAKFLVNGRMSDKSFSRWSKARKLARKILGTFELIYAQSYEDEAKFSALGARHVKRLENLKYANAPLGADDLQLKVLQEKLCGRPIFVAASTHEGEEEIIARVHRKLRDELPMLLTILIPRHPERGDAIASLLTQEGLHIHQRSKKQTIKRSTEIYLADTLGELGLFFRLSEVVFLGGSMVPIGGHNLIEPARLISAIIVGEHMHNFSQMYREFSNAEAVITVSDEDELADTVRKLLSFSATRKKIASAASKIAGKKQNVLEEMMADLNAFLPSR